MQLPAAGKMLAALPQLFGQCGFVEERDAGGEPRLRAVMDGVLRGALVIEIAPKGSCAVDAVFIQCVEENVEGFQFLFVVFIVVSYAVQRFEASIRR